MLTIRCSTLIQRIAGLIRPSSSIKPEVQSLRDRGVAIHALDWVSAPLDELTALLKDEGVEVLISACTADVIDEQTKLVDAAKAAGAVKRFVPCDWATVCPPEAMALEDRVSGRFFTKVERSSGSDGCFLIPETQNPGLC